MVPTFGIYLAFPVVSLAETAAVPPTLSQRPNRSTSDLTITLPAIRMRGAVLTLNLGTQSTIGKNSENRGIGPSMRVVGQPPLSGDPQPQTPNPTLLQTQTRATLVWHFVTNAH